VFAESVYIESQTKSTRGDSSRLTFPCHIHWKVWRWCIVDVREEPPGLLRPVQLWFLRSAEPAARQRFHMCTNTFMHTCTFAACFCPCYYFL